MTILPVMDRELRSTARTGFTYYLRVLGASALVGACLFFGIEHGFGPTLGSRLFANLRLTLFWALWIFVPLLTADCLSRERREGTLGLLFLTRLGAMDIVIAKTAAHALRAFTLWLAVVPVLTIPFLLGGITWMEAALSIAVSFSAICWALAAGLLASAWSRSWHRALLAACLLGIGLLVTFIFLLGTTITMGTFSTSTARRSPASLDFVWLSALGLIGGPATYLRFFLPSRGVLMLALTLMVAISLLGLVLAISVAGHKIGRAWQESPPTQLHLWWQRTFCTPRFWLSFFKRWMRRKLERNPIGWLEQRTWTGRLVTWSWFAVIISVYSTVLTERVFVRGFGAVERIMAVLLDGSLALSAAGSFRRERESGVLELLLVSPLSELDIVSGRLRGLWGQFLPAFVLLFSVWIYFNSLFRTMESSGLIFFHGMAFLTLPVVGLYFSLRCRNFISAFIATMGVGLILPMSIPTLLRFFVDPYSSYRLSPTMEPSAFTQLGLAVLCGRALLWRLRTRNFSFFRES